MSNTNEALSEPPMIYTPRLLRPDGRAPIIEPPYEGWEDDMHFEMVEEREFLLRQLPARGVVHNVDSIASYLRSRDMTFAPYRIFDSTDPDNNRVLAPYGASFADEQDASGARLQVRATYVTSLGLILIARPPQYDSRQPESSLVFCNANAFGVTKYDVFLDEDGEELYRELVQRGFKARDAHGKVQGGLAERSFASLVGGDYRKDQHDNHGVDYPSGPNPQRVFGAGRVHPKYIQERNQVDSNVLGAVALEVLCAHDPGLAPAILEARRSMAGIFAMNARLEAISTGLGRRLLQEEISGLRRIVPDEGLFLLRHVLSATRTPRSDVLDISEASPFSQYAMAQHASTAAEQAEAAQNATRERIEVQTDSQAVDAITQLINEVTGTMQDESNNKSGDNRAE